MSRNEIERTIKYGKHVYAIVDYYEYLQIKELYPDAVGIYVYMSKEDCLANMLIRGDSIEDDLIESKHMMEK